MLNLASENLSHGYTDVTDALVSILERARVADPGSLKLSQEDINKLLNFTRSDLILSPRDVADITIALKGDFWGDSLRSHFLLEMPEAIQHLISDVCNNQSHEQQLLILIETASGSSNTPCRNAARRGLVFLIRSEAISPEILDPELRDAISPLQRADKLLHSMRRGNRRERNQTDLFLSMSPGTSLEDRINMAQGICASPGMFKDAVFGIHRILYSKDKTPESKIVAYDCLLLLQEEIMKNVRGNPEEALFVILSSPGLMEELYEHLTMLDMFRGGEIAKWLIAGLESEYFRDEIIACFAHAAVFGTEDSAIRQQVIYAIQQEKLNRDTFINEVKSRFGSEAASAFEEKLKAEPSISDTINFLKLDTIDRSWISIFTPANDRIIDDALTYICDSIVSEYSGAINDPFIKRIRKSLRTLSGDDLEKIRGLLSLEEGIDPLLIKKAYVVINYPNRHLEIKAWIQSSRF